MAKNKKGFKQISISEKFHANLKELSSNQGISMSKLVENALTKYDYKDSMRNVFIFFSMSDKELIDVDCYKQFSDPWKVSGDFRKSKIVEEEIIKNSNNDKLLIIENTNASKTTTIHKINRFILIEIPILTVSANNKKFYTNQGNHIFYSGEAVLYNNKAIYNKSIYSLQVDKKIEFYENGMPKLNKFGMPLHKNGEPMKYHENPMYNEQNIPLYDNGNPMYNEQGMPIYDNKNPMYNEQGIQLHDNGNLVYDEQGMPLYKQGMPLYDEQGMPLYDTGLPMYNNKGERLNKNQVNKVECEDDNKTPIYTKTIYNFQNKLAKIISFNNKFRIDTDINIDDKNISLLLEELSLGEASSNLKIKKKHFEQLEKEFIDNPDALEELKIDLLAQEKGIQEYLSYQDKIEKLKEIMKI